jgi:hypothetical protein
MVYEGKRLGPLISGELIRLLCCALSGDSKMTTRRVSAPFAAAIAVLVAACGRSNPSSMDDGLKQDLAAVGGSSMELAPKAVRQQMVVSAVEGGPTSAPVRASTNKATAPKPVAKPSQRPTESVAQAPTPTPSPILTAPAPVETRPIEPAPLPPAEPAPVARQQSRRQTGPYKTEAEIFRQMPWIRP